MGYKLSILIATVEGREHFLDPLLNEFNYQIKNGGFEGDIQLIIDKDNKEVSIGAKSQRMLEKAEGTYIVRFDDDDWPFAYYIEEIMIGVDSGKDCIGMLIHMTTNGQRPQTCCHSLRWPNWAERVGGYDYVRNVTHFNPVKRLLALAVGYKDMRFGEDKDYADRLTPICKSEHFINKRLFHYRYVRQMDHNKKYGI